MMTRIHINELRLRVRGDTRHDMRELGNLVGNKLLERCQGNVGEGKISDVTVTVDVAPNSSLQQTAGAIATAIWSQVTRTK